jgi:hypothetical protein
MPIKQNKNKIQLPDQLEIENYIINEKNKHDVIIISQSSPKQNKTINSTKVKQKSSYILFVQKNTAILKTKFPKMTPKERKTEISKLWKIEKEKNS